jgi:hypothetical protein
MEQKYVSDPVCDEAWQISLRVLRRKNGGQRLRPSARQFVKGLKKQMQGLLTPTETAKDRLAPRLRTRLKKEPP